MTILINGYPFYLTKTEPTPLNQVLAEYYQQQQTPNNFAVAVNSAFVGQAHYNNTVINSGDNIDIFTPIQGG